MGFTTQISGASNYSGPFEGKSILFPWDGLTYGKVLSVAHRKTQKNANAFVFTIQCEEPGAEGLTLDKWCLTDGMRSDNLPHAYSLLDVVASAVSAQDGATDEDAVQAAQACEGESIGEEWLNEKIVGKRVYYSVKAGPYDTKSGGKSVSSGVDNMILRSRYEAAVPNHHTPIPEELKRLRTSGGSSAAEKAPQAPAQQASAPAAGSPPAPTANGATKRASKFL